MASLQAHSLKALVVFRNFMYPELIRTVHVYKLEDEGEKEVEREYLFRSNGDYEEIGTYKVLTLEKFCPSAQFEGRVNGVWLCIYLFDADRHCPPNLEDIPTILSILRNPKLVSIPSLANDLQIIFQLNHRTEDGEKLQVPPKETSVGKNAGGFQIENSLPSSSLDLNSFPYPELENEESDKGSDWVSGLVEKRKKRAATKDIARLALEDLAKYFDLPIVEASKNLKVGLTVLKKKCREFGIPRWPHRKIKSLDSLIRDLQAEVEQQQKADEAAAMVVAKRQRMLESEKESIERKPFMEIQRETKKFRQDIFKKRHRARTRDNQIRTMPLF
ncbi:hypothetical protein CEY00_Acc01107 [Actinidia chinensis var. chinensis]|uniref:RWP-RK domain-containing protein n=1 Tax=Actinidia chinensis var. chinensis TaxID=1590841 RepID=A0A2R6S2X7_ACTCC|nr:hypothetical protein CEY00_Acc01107 [Actinidia chinensis var. chinensis]